MRTKHRMLAILGAGIAALAGCAPEESVPSGHVLYGQHCTSCHGTDGRGDAAMARALRTEIPDLTTLAARSGGSFPMVAVMSKVDGYARGEGGGGARMPELGHLLDGSLVRVDTGDGRMTPTPAKLVAIADHLRGLQR